MVLRDGGGKWRVEAGCRDALYLLVGRLILPRYLAEVSCRGIIPARPKLAQITRFHTTQQVFNTFTTFQSFKSFKSQKMEPKAGLEPATLRYHLLVS